MEPTKLENETKILDWYPDVLLLGPGGSGGFLELGAVNYLEKRKLLERVKIFIGVSVGSIISLLLTCGYSSKEIISIAADTNIFQDLSSLSLDEIKENLGVFSTKPLAERLEKYVSTKFGLIPTMDQLYKFSGIDYISISYNSTKIGTEVISRQSFPEMPCVTAALLSMNIPFIFYELKYKGNVYVDGALGNPYPVDVVDDGINNVLGIYVDNQNRENNGNTNVTDYIQAIVQAPMRELRKKNIKNASRRCKHIRLEKTTLDPIGMTLSADDKVTMVIDGYNVMRKTFEGNNSTNDIL